MWARNAARAAIALLVRVEMRVERVKLADKDRRRPSARSQASRASWELRTKRVDVE